VIYAMGRHGIFHSATATAHAKNETPHIAITLMALVAFAVPTFCHAQPCRHPGSVQLCRHLRRLRLPGSVCADHRRCAGLSEVAGPAQTCPCCRLRRLSGAARHPGGGLGLSRAAGAGDVLPLPLSRLSGVGIVWILAFYRRQPSASVSVREDLQLVHDRFTTATAAE
jgi:hypothetical protein